MNQTCHFPFFFPPKLKDCEGLGLTLSNSNIHATPTHSTNRASYRTRNLRLAGDMSTPTSSDELPGKLNIPAGENGSFVVFHRDTHLKYISSLSSKLDKPSSYEGAVTEHLRMSGIYWTYAALSLLVPRPEADRVLGVTSAPSSERPSIVDWVLKCYVTQKGGFAGNLGHDAHILYTLSALQILVMAEYDLKQLPTDDIVKFIVSLQQEDGSFVGDHWGEVDTRFSYCAISALSLLSSLDKINLPKAVEYVASCQNLDGGFGSMKGAESHAGQVFCCVGALSIAKSLHLIKHPDLLGWWLATRPEATHHASLSASQHRWRNY